MIKTISIFGSTGSIGTQALEIIAKQPEYFRAGWLTTHSRIERLEQQIAQYSPFGVVISDKEAYQTFIRTTSFQGTVLAGEEGLLEAASDTRTSQMLSALVGFSGVQPTLQAIQHGIPIALANKETLVSAGELITTAARSNNVAIVPVDSEHSAIAQCLVGESPEFIDKLILTASGGPFREYSLEQLQSVTHREALRHPNWSMGAKITIDSATLMNKGLEVIEAHWLFGVHPDRIEVVIHPQSIIHSMVQFVDGSVKAQLGVPDMKLPIVYALAHPRRLLLPDTLIPRLHITAMGNLTFFVPDTTRFPCLQLAFDALKAGGSAPTVLNAANEIAVHLFLQEKISYVAIPRLIEYCLERIPVSFGAAIQEIVAIDAETRHIASSVSKNI